MTDPTPPKVIRMSAYTILRLSVEALTHPRTVKRAYDGARVQGLSRERIKAAAKRLGLPEPPEAA